MPTLFTSDTSKEVLSAFLAVHTNSNPALNNSRLSEIIQDIETLSPQMHLIDEEAPAALNCHDEIQSFISLSCVMTSVFKWPCGIQQFKLGVQLVNVQCASHGN